MPDYPLMYKTLFRAVGQCVDILQKAQQQTEEIYISAEPADITLVDFTKSDEASNTTPDDD